MKSIASSIIVLAGAMLLAGGAFIRHSQTKSFVMVSGVIVGLMGLTGWLVSFNRE